jgi:hypothetical protein
VRTDSFGIGVWIVVVHPCSSAIERMSVIRRIGFMLLVPGVPARSLSANRPD